MTSSFPTSKELYKAITNDCFSFYLEQSNENSNKETLEKENKNISIIDKLNKLKLIISDNKANKQKYSDIIDFTLKYINIMHTFFEKEKLNNPEVRYYNQYCLAYIALVGFRCFYINNMNEDQIFKFKVDEYKEFSKFLDNYTIKDPIKNFYELNSLEILTKFKDNDELYLNLIYYFDIDNLFDSQIKNEENNEYESYNRDNLETTKNDNEEKQKDLNLNENINRNSNSYADNTTENKNCSSKDNNIHGNLNIIEQNDCEEKIQNNENEINELQKNNINISNNIKDIFLKIENMALQIKSLQSENELLNRLLKGKSIKTDFEIIKVNVKLLEENELLRNEKIFNDAYLKVDKKNPIS